MAVPPSRALSSLLRRSHHLLHPLESQDLQCSGRKISRLPLSRSPLSPFTSQHFLGLSRQANLTLTSPKIPKSARMKSPEPTGMAPVNEPERITSPLRKEIPYMESLLASQATAWAG